MAQDALSGCSLLIEADLYIRGAIIKDRSLTSKTTCILCQVKREQLLRSFHQVQCKISMHTLAKGTYIGPTQVSTCRLETNSALNPKKWSTEQGTKKVARHQQRRVNRIGPGLITSKLHTDGHFDTVQDHHQHPWTGQKPTVDLFCFSDSIILSI